MSDIAGSQKILEVKIRPYSTQERPDQRDLSRVYLSADALLDLTGKLKSGEVCYLWKEEGEKREALAFPSPQKALGKGVVQISKSFQDACGFKLGDDLKISAGGTLETAESIVLRDVTAQILDREITEIQDRDLAGWEWILRESLGRPEAIYAGMTFKNVSGVGQRRSFMVDTVNDKPGGQARFDLDSSLVKISSQTTQKQTNGFRPPLQVIDIAGIDKALAELNDFLSFFDHEFRSGYGERSCATILHGGAGCGKTHVLNKIAATGWGRVHRIAEDTKPPAIRTVFKEAKVSQPSIIIIDDLENIVSNEDAVSKSASRAIGEELDRLVDGSFSSLPRVLVVAATQDISKIPRSLKKIDRFETDILLPTPDTAARKAILRSISQWTDSTISNETIEKTGDRTHAYTPEDLVKLLRKAHRIAERRSRGGDMEDLLILTQEDVEKALLIVRPTAMHDITLQPPKVRWEEIGGQDSVKEALREAVETPIKHPERLERLGGSVKKGLLLYGPPGCSKTLSAQAMATEANLNFFAVKGAELLDMYVGQSEKAIRNIFARARAASPAIIFFDEIDAIAGKRAPGGRNNGVNVLTTLLNEMDGIETLKGVMVLAATNQPQSLDSALLRPGRFDQLIYVAPPDLAGREAILRVKQQKMDMADDVDIPKLARVTEGYSGAEMVGICNAAVDRVIRRITETGDETHQIHMSDFEEAVKKVKKQITPEMVRRYERWASGARDDTD